MKSTACTDCPTAKVALLLSDMWTMLILRDLLKQSMRFNELIDSLAGISTRTLTLKLKRLEALNVISKNDLHYAITTRGKKLLPVINEMEKYGKKYL